MPVDVVGYLYAATVAAGGVFGYVKAGKYQWNSLFSFPVIINFVRCMYSSNSITAIIGCWTGIWWNSRWVWIIYSILIIGNNMLIENYYRLWRIPELTRASKTISCIGWVNWTSGFWIAIRWLNFNKCMCRCIAVSCRYDGFPLVEIGQVHATRFDLCSLCGSIHS